MKNNKFAPFRLLTDMCKISLQIIQNTPSSDILQTLKKSAEIKNNIIEKTVKDFLPPIDREDIVKLAVMLHRLNISLYETLTNLDLTKPTVKHIVDMINLFCSMFENSFKLLPEDFAKKCDNIYFSFKKDFDILAEHNSLTSFDTKYLLKYNIFGKIKKCFDQAAEISDFIVVAAVKNT